MDTEATDSVAQAAESPPAHELHAVDDVQRELADARAKADENHRKYLMAIADFDNHRKLTEKRISDRLAMGKRSTIGKFLPVIDNLQRALSYEQDSEGLRGGLQATMRGFESLLTSEDVKPLTVLGTVFDPRLAEAIGTRDSADHDDDVVVEEVERGYYLGDDLLRPAKVIVARRIAPVAS